MLARVSAYLSLFLGIWGALAVLSVMGAAVGLAFGLLALICGSAALSERPEGRVRRVARAGVAAGAIAVTSFVVLILYDVLAF